MQNQFQPEENPTPQSASRAAPQTPRAAETEAQAQAAQAVTQRLNEITTRANRSAKWFKIGYYVSSLCGLIGIFLIPMLLGRHNPLSNSLALQLTTVAVIGMGLSLWGAYRKAPQFSAAEIARLGGVQAIPPLFAALWSIASPPQRKAIRDALTLLLPQMKASDASLLSATSRQMIHGWLGRFHFDRQKYACENALRIAALKALEQVGNAKDVPVVEKLIRRKARTPGEKIVRQAAMECLPMLLMNCGEVEAARTLLRASQAEDARPATLLRPASGAAQTGSQDLLRGAEPPGEKDAGEAGE